MSYIDRSDGQRLLIAAVVAGVAGYFGARALGPGVWIPLLTTALLFPILVRGMKRDPASAIAIAALAGHSMWMIAGAVLVPGALPLVLVDVVLNLFLLLWLLVRPGYGVAAMIILYEAFGLASNAFSMTGNWAGDRLILVHILVRLLIVSGAIGVIRFARSGGLKRAQKSNLAGASE